MHRVSTYSPVHEKIRGKKTRENDAVHTVGCIMLYGNLDFVRLHSCQVLYVQC